MSAKSQAAIAELRLRLGRTAHRLTSQRIRIVEAFAASRKYTSARQLHARLQAQSPRIGLATVYRTLETLRELGLVTATQREGEMSYLFCSPAHHHHAVCTQCGRVDEVPCRGASRLGRMLSHGLRFRLTQHHMEFYGLCARCS